jgi:hypothetical protein
MAVCSKSTLARGLWQAIRNGAPRGTIVTAIGDQVSPRNVKSRGLSRPCPLAFRLGGDTKSDATSRA